MLALFTLVLMFHEAGAPRIVWLHILGALALVQVLPEGWIKRIASVWFYGSVVFLLVMVIPFMVHQIRTGIFPQLEYQRPVPGFAQTAVHMQTEMLDEETAGEEATPKEIAPDRRMKRSYISDAALPLKARSKKGGLGQDPNALIQTGPGLPSWSWKQHPMRLTPKPGYLHDS